MSNPWLSIDLGAGIVAVQTHRGEGAGPYGGFNLGLHVGDDESQVCANRARLIEPFGAVPVFPHQVHGVVAVEVSSSADRVPEADAVWTRATGVPIGVLTADCLPVMFSGDGVIGVAHAGWRGLVGGVLEATIASMGLESIQRAWLGPAIGPAAFEVGPEVVEAFLMWDANARRAMRPSGRPGHAYVDLPRLALERLQGLGIAHVERLDTCTVSDPSQWYSFRREGITGRMASCLMRTE